MSPARLAELGEDHVGDLVILIVVAGEPGQVLGALALGAFAVFTLLLVIAVVVIAALPVLRANSLSVAANSLTSANIPREPSSSTVATANSGLH